ncbi:hypothetical protein HDU98_007530 [Podochytrium sp. JEL0797]|nr:hypothetical protein HDU98_007530 [Podochytrium sp. JEL0797]
MNQFNEDEMYIALNQPYYPQQQQQQDQQHQQPPSREASENARLIEQIDTAPHHILQQVLHAVRLSSSGRRQFLAAAFPDENPSSHCVVCHQQFDPAFNHATACKMEAEPADDQTCRRNCYCECSSCDSWVCRCGKVVCEFEEDEHQYCSIDAHKSATASTVQKYSYESDSGGECKACCQIAGWPYEAEGDGGDVVPPFKYVLEY